MERIKVTPESWVQGPGYRKQRLANERLLQNMGALVQMVEMVPGAKIPAHFHRESTEFYYPLQGQCSLSVDNEILTLTPGEMVVIETEDVHSLLNDGQETFRLLVFKTNAPTEDTFWPPAEPE